MDCGTYARPAKYLLPSAASSCSGLLRRLGGEDSGRGKLRRRYVIHRTIGPNALDAEPIKRGEAASLLADDVTRQRSRMLDRLTRGYAKRSFHFPPRGTPIGFYNSLAVLRGGNFNAFTKHTSMRGVAFMRITAMKSSSNEVFNRAKTKKLYKEIAKRYNMFRLRLCRRLQSTLVITFSFEIIRLKRFFVPALNCYLEMQGTHFASDKDATYNSLTTQWGNFNTPSWFALRY